MKTDKVMRGMQTAFAGAMKTAQGTGGAPLPPPPPLRWWERAIDVVYGVVYVLLVLLGWALGAAAAGATLYGVAYVIRLGWEAGASQ